jgi:hypothetical protein
MYGDPWISASFVATKPPKRERAPPDHHMRL